MKRGKGKKTEKLQFCYSGTVLGIMKNASLVITTPVPERYSRFLLGTVEHAASYDFPVQYWPLNAGVVGPMTRTPDPDLLRTMIEAGKELESQGVKSISTTCGYYAYFQDEVANALNVPFASGSLMAVPLVSRLIGSNKRVGIIVWDSRILTKKHLAGAGIDESIKYGIIGYETYKEKRVKEGSPITTLEMLEEDLVDAAKKLVEKYPDIGAIVLECSFFPPAAYAVQKATGLPVFDVVGLLNWLGKSVVRKRLTLPE